MRLTSTPLSSSHLDTPCEYRLHSPAPEHVQRPCLHCGANLDELVLTGFDTRFGIPGTYDVWRCRACQLEQLFPVPTSQELKSLYQAYYNFGAETGTTYTKLRERFFSSLLYRFWTRLDGDISFHLKKGTGRLIDVGCNEGRGLQLYEANGFQVEGLELNETAAAQARIRGFTVHTGAIAEVAKSPAFDVVVLSNVLEHAPDPRHMLSDVHGMLAPQGQIWISCPNSQSWLRKMFGKFWINWHLPFHISHFSPQTLKIALEQSGFANIRVRHATPSSWVAMSIITAMFAQQGRATRQLRNPALFAALILLVRFLLFPVLWMTNRAAKGDCLLVTATKS